jgi:isoquinoline 1-oxidoreductase beta subunit
MTLADRAMTRRSFFFGISVMTGAVVLSDFDLAATAAPTSKSVTSPEITVWVLIDSADSVTIRVARSEMGQGTLTGLAMLVAEELECEWARVRTEYVTPAESLLRNRAWGPMVTAGSLGIRASQDYLRKAGAQARTMLTEEAAARWNVPPEECHCRNGVVHHPATARSVGFGEIAGAASQRPVPIDVTLKEPSEWRLIGRSVRRLDTPDKVFGRPIYASDVRLPGMLYAAVAACPALGGKCRSFDRAAIENMSGVRHVLPVADDAVAVVADSFWQAKKGLEHLPIVWDETATHDLSTPKIKARFQSSLEATDLAIGRQAGNIEKAFDSASRTIQADYDVPYLAHLTMEPQTCTARVTADKAEVWAPTQDGEATLNTVARTLNIDPHKVVVHKCHLGGGFGRRGHAQDWAVQAVLIARQIESPVKLQWTREEDVQHDVCRPLVVARQTASFDDLGRLTGWKVRVAGSSFNAKLAPSRLVNGQDLEMMNGFQVEDMFYDVPSIDVRYAMRNTTIPVGFWRGVNHSQNGFFRESFVDEMAHVHNEDPYQFRRKLLVNAPRSLRLLDAVAQKAEWGKTSPGIHQGIALVECYDTVCVQLVDVSVGADGGLKIHRVVVGIDSGYVVNPALVIAQMEGAVAWALASVMTSAITHTKGRVDQSNFHDCPALRMFEMPPVETLLLPSGNRYLNRWGGIGEPGVPPLAPAITNAVFAATSRRIRSLPLKQHNLRLAA